MTFAAQALERSRGLRYLQCLFVLCTALLVMGAGSSDLLREYDFNIPEQNAETALNTLAEQTDRPLLFLYDQVQAVTAHPLIGRYTVAEALSILLQGTGLKHGLTEEDVITIVDDAYSNNNLRQDTVNNKKNLLAAIIGFVVGSGGQGAFAQDTDHPTERKYIEEVMVTAEHRQASLQDTGISITAFSENTINDLGISNASDIGDFTPNVTMSPMIGGRSGVSVNIRGVRSGESRMTFDPAVGIYLDGVLVSKNAGSLLDVVDLERIEILRGPQGTLYGRNTVGGAISLITKKPTDEFEVNLKTTQGNYNLQRYQALVNIPLLDESSGIGKLNLRASALTIDRDGFYDNDLAGAPNKEMQTQNRDVMTARLRWQPTDALDVLYSYDRTDSDEVPIPMFTTHTRAGSTAGGLLAPYGSAKVSRSDSGSWDSDHYGKLDVEGNALNITYDINDQMTLSSITAKRETVNNAAGGSDGGPLAILSTFDYSEVDVFTQEFKLVGTAFDDQLNYVLGAYYLDEEGYEASGTLIFGSGLPSPVDWETEAKALYMQATYTLDEHWEVTAGIRYTEEDRTMTRTLQNAMGALQSYTAKGKFDNVSPMIRASYNWSDNVMTYASVSQGYQSGGFNSRLRGYKDFLEGFDEETMTSYEFGWKTEFDDRRYRLNGAVFFSDYDDKQVGNLNLETLENVLRNAGVVEIYGMELELLANLTDNLELGINYGYTKAEYTKYQDADGTDLRHYNFAYTPENTAHVSLSYYFPRMNIGQLNARVDWTYQDKITFLAPSPELNSQDAYSLLSARVTLSEISGPGDSEMRVSLWGKNLLDKDYWNFGSNLYNSFGFNINSYGDPRTFGLDLEISF